MKNRRQDSEDILGFTLIELLVVLGIISILAALLYPVFLSSKQNAQNITCISNLHQIGISIDMYCQDYDDYLPYASDPATKYVVQQGLPEYGSTIDKAILNLPVIMTILHPYGAFSKIFLCPCDTQPQQVIGNLHGDSWYAIYGSSYLYSDWNGLLVTPLSYFQQPADSYLMGDGWCYHDKPQDNSMACGFFNVLHIDMHVKALTPLQREDAIDISDRFAIQNVN